MLTDEQILQIAKEKAFFGLYGPSKLTDMGNGTARCLPSTTLTYFGENLLCFARAVELLVMKEVDHV